MAIGYLTIQARTAHDAVPLGGVQIRVLNRQGNSVYVLTTDENGETEQIPLETVDKSFSQNPYYAGTPYISYNVLAQMSGFNSLYVKSIPIYEGENALLPITLVPMQESQRSPLQAEISIGKPAVTEQGSRTQEGTVTEPESRILRQVVIPNPITVHLGTPTSSASNVQVSFPDYVKNVASSEIYPTWPEAALRANIYAIITFALNRIYTEWYRNRGYSFDITNSTAYDQAFVYGRPIYSSISRIVDAIFNEYVRRQGQIAPYFTSFCNGTTATCQGLSQWGTVTLANQGYTPLQILRSYYPNDIEIVQTNIITNVISSYPGTPLRTGSTGLDVQTIQTYLTRIRRNYPAIPAISDPAGTFGSSTNAAVTKFQSIFNLTPDGIVGKSTWYKISSLYAAVAKLAELNSEGNTLGIGTVPPSSTLRQGSRGPDVITLQYLLNLVSEYYPGIPAPTQDGIFGSGTRQSVIAFQQIMGLQADGIVGTATWRALYNTYLGIGQNVPSPGPDPEPGTITYVVQPGDSLWIIAQRYGTTVDAIKRLNGLSGDMLNIGQVLKIPAGQAPGYIEYTVRAGDTLWLLSRRYNTTVDAIKQLNGLSSDMLSIGQVLKIPA
ncbi:MAG: LysM peptidoglycan-binding domain-containing protein [Lachnospiraceae bacterium]|jgi:LysM repeat protein|nr:LysM peptidoglycan-binding domain-containing protein [Lachnospiraceae bacterium]MCI9109079.1 LysM peptidoglycan-binding domain-containing protein [Lachnospiraceae bacterium]MCI9342679.1 LysM peptidoglycan-binding domain-containing protein [Lachnospiraceae bacterium]